MFSAALITDRNGSLDWVLLGCERFVTADQVWEAPVTDGAVLRWADGRPSELVIEAYCSRCPGTTDGYLVGIGVDQDPAAVRLCSGCALAVAPAAMLRWVALDRAAVEFGLPVRLADTELSDRVRHQRQLRSVLDGVEATVIGGELPHRVGDPAWRAHVARAATANRQVAAAIADAVTVLDDLDVLEFYPALVELGQALPRTAIRHLESTSLVAAARLGLPRLSADA